jgi:hypothetical protein
LLFVSSALGLSLLKDGIVLNWYLFSKDSFDKFGSCCSSVSRFLHF